MSTRDEQQRVCETCAHPKRGHELPRAEGGHGGGTSGRCVVYGCNCNRFVESSKYSEQEYIGDDLPKWVKDGVRLRVKKTSHTSRYGLSGTHGNDTVWPGEIGVIQRQDNIGWWQWRVVFKRGQSVTLKLNNLGDLARASGAR